MKKYGLQLAVFFLPALYALPALAAEEHGGSKTLPQLEIGTYPNVIFWMVASFVIFFLFMQFVGIPGYLKTTGKRRALLEVDLDSARKAGETAKDVVVAYEQSLLEARRKAHETVGGIIAAVTQESTEAKEKQQQEFFHRMTVAQANLAESKQNAMREVQQNVNDLVMEVVAKMLETGIGGKAAKAVK